MATTLHAPASAGDRQSAASVDVRALETELLTRTAELSRELPVGTRPVELRRLATDVTRRGNPTIARWLRIALGAVQRGQDAALYGELVADVLGAACAAALPVRDASLAETLAECAADPLQERANRPDATPCDLLAAAKALDEEARRATDAARSYRRQWRAAINPDRAA